MFSVLYSKSAFDVINNYSLATNYLFKCSVPVRYTLLNRPWLVRQSLVW